MKIKNFSILLIVTVVLITVMLYNSVTTKNKFYNAFAEASHRDELVVAIDENQSGYSNVDGKPTGFLYDILNAYCKDKSIELTIVPKISPSYAMDMLENGDIDIASLTSLDRSQLNIHNLTPTFNSKFVVVATKSGAKKGRYSNKLKSLPKGSEVVITQNFKQTKGYNNWIKSADTEVVVSADSPHSLMTKLSKGEFDYLICNDLDAAKFIQKNRDLKIIHQFDDEVLQLLSINIQNGWLEDSFNEWFEEFTASDKYTDIARLYDLNSSKDSRSTIISSYDDLIQAQSREQGFDWRFISAIAYNESRFKAEVRSPRGATGLMQIMPSIARHYDMDAKEIQDPKNNIDVALKLLIAIEASLKLPPSTSENDKLSIMLACYNGGIGHVFDAQRLARKYGYDPYKWASVSKFLLAKGDAEFYNDEVVKYGAFAGIETTAFVDKVLKQYAFYCQRASL